MTMVVTEVQRVATSGARAVESFRAGGLDLIAIPQLAVDVAGGPVGMNAGDSTTDLLLLRRTADGYTEHARLPAPGGEDAEFFTIGERSFLAVASIRTGSGPYIYTVESTIFEWSGVGFAPFQSISTYAAKQWKHWEIDGRHFLGLAQGVDLPHLTGPNRDSVVFEWDGTRFVEGQVIPSAWAYNWHPLRVAEEFFVAHADHLRPSVLYRWDGTRLVAHQELVERAGRAFADFTVGPDHYLMVASLEEPVQVLRWDGKEFRLVQTLAGLGARELTVVETAGGLFVIRVNFILGTPADPDPILTSQVYGWQHGELQLVAEFPTCGGTDAAVVSTGPDGIEFVVSNSLSPTLRFATDSVRYALSWANERTTRS